MKWLKGFLLTVLALALSLSAACAKQQEVTVSCNTSDGRLLYFEEMMVNGVVMLHEDQYGSVHLNFNAISDGLYTVKLLGVAQNGQDFEMHTTITEGYGYASWDVADTVGTYGPYRLQIVGENHSQEYDVAFVVEEDQYANTYEIAVEGNRRGYSDAEFRVLQAGTVQASGGLVIEYPENQYPLSGSAGYEIGFHIDRGETLPDPLFLEVTDAETGAVIHEQELVIDEWYAEDPKVYVRITMPAFESGKEYRFAFSGEGVSGEITYLLLDELVETGPVQPDDVELMLCDLADYTAEPVPLESLMQEDGMIHLQTNMGGALRLGTRLHGNACPITRLVFAGTSSRGHEISNTSSLITTSRDYVSRTELSISSTPGAYPITLRVQNGHMTKEYPLLITVPEGASTRYSGILDYSMNAVHHFQSRWDLQPETPQLTAAGGEPQAAFTSYMGGDGATYVGVPSDRLTVYAEVANMRGDLLTGLFDYTTQKYIASSTCWYDGMYENKVGNGSANGSMTVEEFDSGKTYGLTLVGEDGSVLAVQDIVLINSEEVYPYAPTAPLDAALCDAQLVSLVQEQLAGMSMVQLGEPNGFWQHRYAQPQLSGVLAGSFAVYDPVVDEPSVRYEVSDLLSSANWTVYDQYLLQFRDGFRYPDMQAIGLTALNERFAQGWQNLAAFAFAQGYASGEDGTSYYVLPVYYPAQEGGIENNEVYLYVLAICSGMDRELIDAQENYTWIDTGDALYNVNRMLITDQALVAGVLKTLQQKTGDWPMPNVTDYQELTEGMEGRTVLSMQDALSQLGYLATSVDGVYGATTTEAVKAYQKDHKLKQNGNANAATLESLFAQCDTRALLLTWLNEH